MALIVYDTSGYIQLRSHCKKEIVRARDNTMNIITMNEYNYNEYNYSGSKLTFHIESPPICQE